MKKAFTLLELVFVIVIIAILSVAVIPRLSNNSLQEAAIQLVSHIRYTQHLAMIDDVYSSNDINWYKKRWQLIFSRTISPDSTVGYSIFSDIATASGTTTAGDVDIEEVATNPQDKNKLLTGGYSHAIHSDNLKVTKKLNLELSYGIDDVRFTGGCSGLRLSFDYLGRPIKGDLDSMTGPYHAGTKRLIHDNCIITLYSGLNSIAIKIVPESGYSCIINENLECIE